MVFKWLGKAISESEQRNKNRIKEQEHIDNLVEVFKNEIIKWNKVEFDTIFERINEADFQKFIEVYSKEEAFFSSLSTEFLWESAVLGMDSGYHKKNNELEVNEIKSNLFEIFTKYGIQNGTVYSEYVAASNRVFKKGYSLGRKNQI